MMGIGKGCWQAARLLWAGISLVFCASGAMAQGANPPREVAVDPSLFLRGAPLPAWYPLTERLPAALPDNPLVIRLAETYIRIGEEPRVLVHRAIQVNDAAVVPEVGQYPVIFHPEYQHIELHRLQIHRGGARLDRLPGVTVRFFHAERNVEQAIYTGSITATVIPEDVRSGDTLEILYSIVGQNPVFAGKFVDAVAWDNPAPIVQRRISLDMPRDRRVLHRAVGGGDLPVASESVAGERRIVRYEAANLPAAEPEALLPPDVFPLRWIQFSEFSDWSEIGVWARGLFAAGAAAPPPVPAGLAAATPEETVLRALHFVQDEVRYLSISIGENSHRPYPPAEVIARRYGDCKDKSLLLVALLRQLGIQAEPVLVSTQFRKGLGDLLPSPGLFDHAIVRVTLGSRVHYLDPTLQGQAARLDALAPVHEGNEVFVVSESSRGLAVIPYRAVGLPPVSGRSERVAVERLDQPAEMRIEFVYRAEDAEAARRALVRMTSAQVRKAYEGILDRRYPKAELLADPKVSDDRAANSVTVEARYRIPEFFEKQGERWLVRYEASNLGSILPMPNSAKRRYPIAMPGYPWQGTYRLDIQLPEDFDARYTPERRTLRGEAFLLEEALSFSGRRLGLDVSLQLTGDRVAATGAPQYLADLRTANGYFRGTLFVGERDRRTAAAALPIKELSRQRLEQVMANTEKALASSRLGNRDTSAIHCERAIAAAYLERFEVARQEAEAAVGEQPTGQEPLRCRGTIRLVGGDFGGSVRDLSRTIALGQGDPELYFYRGLAYFYDRQWRQAGEDFSAYGRLAADDRARAQAAVWRAVARQRAGESPAPEALSTTVWPAPVLKVFRGQASIEDVLEELNRSDSGAKLEEKLAEAYLYFYQHLVTSNVPRSMAYLKRSLDLAPLYSFVQVAARHEKNRGATAGR